MSDATSTKKASLGKGARLTVVGLPALIGLVLLAMDILRPGIGMILISVLLGAKILRFKLNPLTERKIRRFKAIRRGYYSFIALLLVTVLSLFAELLVGGRAIAVRYNGELSFPVFGDVQMGSVFGLEGEKSYIPVNYRDLDRTFEEQGGDNWVLMPLVPYSPDEQSIFEGSYKPAPPDASTEHYLGTDSLGRDILSRLVYGVRIAIFFSLAYTATVFVVGISIGSMMGYLGGWFDLICQRLIEIWSLIPFLYIVIIIYSLIPASQTATVRIGILLVIMAIFGWISLTYYMRTAIYREKARDYAAAAQLLGASNTRIIFRHLLPNAISTIVTFLPFIVAAAISAVTALDFLGFGLPVPTPSIGELLKQGTERLNAPWIVSSAFVALVVLLTLVTFVGEAVREAFDPKQFSYYR